MDKRRSYLFAFLAIIFSFTSLFSEIGIPEYEKNSGEASKRHETVVFIHGFMRTQRSMTKIARSFEKEGFTTYRFWYKGKEGYIEDHAKKLVEELNGLTQQNPENRIHFVTHSLGGLILRKALNDPKCPPHALMGRVVMLAPPNQGSSLARKLYNQAWFRKLVGDKSGRQLASITKKDILKLGAFPKKMPILVIAGMSGLNPILEGANDGKVTVKETYLPEKHLHRVVQEGHAFIMNNSQVIDLSKSFIQNKDIK